MLLLKDNISHAQYLPHISLAWRKNLHLNLSFSAVPQPAFSYFNIKIFTPTFWLPYFVFFFSSGTLPVLFSLFSPLTSKSGTSGTRPSASAHLREWSCCPLTAPWLGLLWCPRVEMFLLFIPCQVFRPSHLRRRLFFLQDSVHPTRREPDQPDHPQPVLFLPICRRWQRRADVGPPQVRSANASQYNKSNFKKEEIKMSPVHFLPLLMCTGLCPRGSWPATLRPSHVWRLRNWVVGRTWS